MSTDEQARAFEPTRNDPPKKGASNRAERRARGRRIGRWDNGRAFRLPSARVRVHRVPLDSQPADRSGTRLHGRTRYGQAEDERAAWTGRAG